MGMISHSYRGPTEITYLFIDGAYLTERLKSFGERWFDGPVDFDYRALGSQFTKTFYYDCLPSQRADENDVAYAARRSVKEDFFNGLRQHHGWHVIEGISKRRKGSSTQKEVDILIAVDMLTHTYRKNMHKVTFIAGDQDFRPLLDAVVRDGMYVDLWYDRTSISTELVHTADSSKVLDLYSLHPFFTNEFKTKYQLPARSLNQGTGVPGNSVQIEVGKRNGQLEATLWEVGNFKDYLLVVEKRNSARQQLHYKISKQVDFLKRVHAEYEGPVEWSPA